MIIFRLLLAVFMMTFALLAGAFVSHADHTIYLVRHAEKAETSNPPLTMKGSIRAKALAEFLKDKNVTNVFSTDYKRTLETAMPTAKQASVDVVLYDPRELNLMKGQLLLARGVTLVVGHSNTTPRLFNLLTGLDHKDLEEHQYDRIYTVKMLAGNEISYGIQYLEPRTP